MDGGPLLICLPRVKEFVASYRLEEGGTRLK